jgi:hypothetical protein
MTLVEGWVLVPAPWSNSDPARRRHSPAAGRHDPLSYTLPMLIGSGWRVDRVESYRMSAVCQQDGACQQDGGGTMLLTWLTIFLAPPLGGYLLGRMRPGASRSALLASFMAAPPLLLTALLATARPAPEGFLIWWQAGMEILFVPAVIWATGALIGFSVRRRNAR